MITFQNVFYGMHKVNSPAGAGSQGGGGGGCFVIQGLALGVWVKAVGVTRDDWNRCCS